MISNVKQLMEQIMADQEMIRTSELKALQSQINPHFLYNTLDSMKWLGVTHHVPQVATLATDLAVILRAGISGQRVYHAGGRAGAGGPLHRHPVPPVRGPLHL